MERVVAYIDGFNLYFGMKSGGNNTLWLDVRKLVCLLLKPDQELVYTNYFTSRIRNDKSKEKRQKLYIEALKTLPNFKISNGHYQSHVEECRHCGNSYLYSNEKMTDVNIAVALMEDAFANKCDTAFLITGDSDLVPAMKSVHRLCHDKRIFVAFPPYRFNMSVKDASKGCMTIGRKKLKDAQFPDEVTKKNGFVVRKPDSWV